jgi:hypothetical protein
MIYLIHYKNFSKGHNVPSPSTTIEKVGPPSVFSHTTLLEIETDNTKQTEQDNRQPP